MVDRFRGVPRGSTERDINGYFTGYCWPPRVGTESGAMRLAMPGVLMRVGRQMGRCEGPVPLHDYNSVLLYKRAIKPRLVT